MTTINIYCGIFDNEKGCRFLQMALTICDNAFNDLYHKCGNNKSKYKDCLICVKNWDESVITDEIQKLDDEFIDCQDLFKDIYVLYVRAMKESAGSKIMINLPSFEKFVHNYCIELCKTEPIYTGKFFSNNLTDKRLITMDTVRNTLFNLTSDLYIQLEDETTVESVVFSNIEPKKIEDDIRPEDSISNINVEAYRSTHHKAQSLISLSSHNKKEVHLANIDEKKLAESEASRTKSEASRVKSKTSHVNSETSRSQNQLPHTKHISAKTSVSVRNVKDDTKAQSYVSNTTSHLKKKDIIISNEKRLDVESDILTHISNAAKNTKKSEVSSYVCKNPREESEADSRISKHQKDINTPSNSDDETQNSDKIDKSSIVSLLSTHSIHKNDEKRYGMRSRKKSSPHKSFVTSFDDSD